MNIESGRTLRYSSYSAPDGAALNDSTGEIRWTPSLTQDGKIYTFAIIASDGTHAVQQNVTIHLR